MKILFCTLHVRRSLQAVPLAAGCLAAALPEDLRKASVNLEVYPDQSDREILSLILGRSPDVVAFPIYLWNRKRLVEIVRQLHHDRPSIMLVAGGPEATGDAEGLTIEAPWTALVHGEGEAAFRNLLVALASGATGQPLPGVTLLQEQGRLEGGPCNTFDLETASSPWLSGALKPERGGGVLWEVARGCAFSCDYCFDARGHAGVRGIPRQRLERELELFVEAEVSQVWVLDSTFNYPPERGIALLELLVEKAPQLHYHLEAKADFIDRRTASLLSELRCSLQLGLQSVHKDVLKAVRRPLDLEVMAEKIHLLEGEGVIYGFDLIYGLPHDNYAGFCDSVDTVLSFAPNHVHIFPLSILPGTRLAQLRERHQIKAQEEPPYELLSSKNWTAEEMERARRLAASVDLFYNTGRAVAFFPAILQTLQTKPSTLLEDFYIWVLHQDDIDEETLSQHESLPEDAAYRLIQGYLCHELQRIGQGHLVSVFLDLLCFHYHYAETLLGEELLPPRKIEAQVSELWETPLKRSQNCRLVPFAYEILDLLEMEEMQLGELAELFRPVGSVALFMRRGEEVFCESLSDEMLLLLKQSDGSRSPEEIFCGSLSRATGEELVHFALEEGLLYRAEPVAT